ncbi:hypothetical protein L1887_32576 [Cichorium endivia]|nr:hypothetical protein L1887_32576 [Cichorium endivia]
MEKRTVSTEQKRMVRAKEKSNGESEVNDGFGDPLVPVWTHHTNSDLIDPMRLNDQGRKRIEQFKKAHTRKDGTWDSDLAYQQYVELEREFQLLNDPSPEPSKEVGVFEKVLGSRRGHYKGIGRKAPVTATIPPHFDVGQSSQEAPIKDTLAQMLEDPRHKDALAEFLLSSEDVSNFSQLSHLLPSCLTSLRIQQFEKVESVSMGLQHLTSLQHLSISDFPKAIDLPKMLLPSLLSLEIIRCPNLKERSSKRGSYWPLVSRIPYIHIP